MNLEAGGYGDQLVAVLSAVADLLADLPARVSRLSGSDLEVVLPVVDRLAAVAGAGRYTITAEAVQRGEVAASQAAAQVTPAGVRWNRRLGSYDEALARGPTATPAD